MYISDKFFAGASGLRTTLKELLYGLYYKGLLQEWTEVRMYEYGFWSNT
jgi:hypothetical protein